MKPLILTFVGLFILGSAVSFLGERPPEGPSAAQLETERLQRKIEACKGSGKTIDSMGVIMREEQDYRKVYVNKSWGLLPVNRKEDFATIIANCLAGDEHTEIYDGFSGKKLAQYTPLGKFKVE